ncbi:MAG: NAD-dependent epimerase/dehydratase family protein [Acidobacteriota bacterium]|nr:NAD-dependent epimerase/dehydratase family protein [Acidobacteriota bacterium]
MRVFLTGASGYVGTVLSDRLMRAGHEVRALVRPTSDRSQLDELGVSCFLGDVTDRYSMREAMSGSDWVIHAAADLEFGGPAERMRRVNVEGSENVASLAYKLGVGRLLSVSSIAVFGGSFADGTAGDEESPPVEPMPTLYSATKREGERAIQAWAEKGLAVNTVYPSLVYGPPTKKSGANAILRTIVKGRLPAVVGGDRKSSWIHIEDLTRGIEKVMQMAPPGENYLLAGDGVTIAEIVGEASRLAGVKPPRLALPVGVAKVMGWVTRPYFRLRGFRSPFVPEQLASVGRHWYFDDAKARRELDWSPRSLAEGLPETVEFLTP